MKLLLDTHALLWSVFEPDRLSKKAAAAIIDVNNTILVSAISFWEISLKYSIGKLELKGVSPEAFPALAKEAGFDLIPLDHNEAATFHTLPRLPHKDPFDLMIIRQAISQHLTLISADRSFRVYREHGLKTFW